MDTTILDTMSRQIGAMNIMAISGGRRHAITETLLALPVARGYVVEVEYMPGSDTYTVRRAFVRKGVKSIKGEMEYVYCDQLGDVAYKASCYHDSFGGAS